MFIVSYDLLSDMPISSKAPITFSAVASLMAHSCPLLVYGVKLFSCPVLYDAQRKVGYNNEGGEEVMRANLKRMKLLPLAGRDSMDST